MFSKRLLLLIGGIGMTYQAISMLGTREVNEDSVCTEYFNGCGLFVVADGLGGHGKGDVASMLTVNAFKETFSNHSEPLPALLPKAFLNAQTAILAEQARTGCPFQMKTTVCALAIDNGKLMWGHIGDTRLYAFSRNKVKVRTLDHSVPQMLVLAHDIKEKDIRNHPDRNKLLRVLGVSGDVPKFEVTEVQNAAKYQAFLLCSDGFWEHILEKEMCAALKKSSSVAEWLGEMQEIVEQRGSSVDMDNYSAITVWI